MPKKPTKAFIDADVYLFKSASAGEQVKYAYKTPSGKTVATFNSAKEGKSWIEECEMMGCDFSHGYDGDFSELVREQYFEDIGFEKCQETWKKTMDSLLKDIGDIPSVILISPSTGLKNFRYDIATIKPYKGTRKEVRLPMYLEQTREWVTSLPNVKSPKSRLEIDDWTLAYAQREGEKGLAVAADKDVRTGVGCWIFHDGDMEDIEYSDPSTVGYLEWDGKKMRGLGYLFLLYQACSGDPVDGYSGIPRFGAAKAFKLLSPFNSKPLSCMNEILGLCIKEYKKSYGETHTYKHCTTGEDITGTPYSLFKENLSLAYMLKGQKDSAEKSVLRYLDEASV